MNTKPYSSKPARSTADRQRSRRLCSRAMVSGRRPSGSHSFASRPRQTATAADADDSGEEGSERGKPIRSRVREQACERARGGAPRARLINHNELERTEPKSGRTGRGKKRGPRCCRCATSICSLSLSLPLNPALATELLFGVLNEAVRDA